MRGPAPERRATGASVVLQVLLPLVALLASGAIAAGTARAQAPDPREMQAKTACLGGHPDAGIELLAQLYAETNDPTYIYNQGRCFQQNGRAEAAITRFREYLRKVPSISAEERADVEAKIAETERDLASARTTQPPPQPPPPAIAAPLPAVPPAPPPAEPPRGGGGRAMRIAGLVVGAVGGAVLGGAVVMGLRARALADDVSAEAQAGTFDRSKYDDGQRAETLQWIGYGVGAAALAGGGLLYFLGARAATGDSAVVAAGPRAGGGVNAVVRVRF